ncbi:MAG: hypothetical protein HQM15_02405 [Deltaproteobacteria bacterium]|nr:hypothetical protein [Deltaproteobacteria bacterium]
MKREDLIKLLNEVHTEYMLIGAEACAHHGHVRATQDIDILINPSEENISRARKALEKFGYDTSDASLEDFQTKKILFRQYWYALDIHPTAKGIETEKGLKNKVRGMFEGEPTYFASLDDLIKMKKAAARPKDLEDLRYLEEIQRQLALQKSSSKD